MKILKSKDILNILSTTEYTTAAVLSAALKVSDKTIRKRIKELNDELSDFGAHIESKQKYGYILIVDDEEKYHLVYQAEDTNKIPTTLDERIQYILAFLLTHVDYIKIDNLCDFLYVSRNTITADIKKAEAVLEMYHLHLERKSNYGIKLIGDEFNKRACIVNSFIKKNILLVNDTEGIKRMKKVEQILLEIVERESFEISEIEFENIVKYITISISRVKHGFSLNLSKEKVAAGINDVFYKIAKNIIRRVEKEFSISYCKDEIKYLAIQLSVKLDTNEMQRSLVISADIDEIVKQILDYIYDTMKIDFRRNLELRVALSQHMISLNIRIQYHIPLKSPQGGGMKFAYPLAYALSAAASVIVNEKYQTELDEEEISYLAIPFALILEKQENMIQKKNIIIVCVSGNETSRLLAYRYKKIFGEYIANIYECTILKLKQFDFQKYRVDYIFTTAPIDFEVPVQVVLINLFPSRDEIETYRGILERNDSSLLHKYYKRELFISRLQAKTKEETIWKMCEHIEAYYRLPAEFYHSVMKRESVCSTDFGNFTALPHPAETVTSFNFVSVAVLEKPIWWERSEVQVVFLVSLSVDVEDDIQEFYQATMNLIVDSKRIQKLIREPGYDTLLSLL